MNVRLYIRDDIDGNLIGQKRVNSDLNIYSTLTEFSPTKEGHIQIGWQINFNGTWVVASPTDTYENIPGFEQAAEGLVAPVWELVPVVPKVIIHGAVGTRKAIKSITPPPDYLCFTANTAGSTVQLIKEGTPTEVELEISTDGNTWTDYTIGNTITLSSVGDKVYMRNKSETPTGFSLNTYEDMYYFTIDGSVAVSGDINYLLCKNSTTTLTSDGCFMYLFDSCPITTAPSLPATTLTDECYEYMFSGCTSLTIAPQLPATILAHACYAVMFLDCTSLVTAPELPATALADECYSYMFNGCTSLTAAPELPATTLVDACYSSMFQGCTSLTTAPELPATELADTCYEYMFQDCTSLVTPPELPATTLAEDCYQYMFQCCTSLVTAPELPATTLAEYCYNGMFTGCESLATAPELPATTLVKDCYEFMFEGCIALKTLPSLPATTLTEYCYAGMFRGCTLIKVSEEQVAKFVNAYRIPSSGTGVTATGALINMFADTGGPFKGTPSINTTYYTVNTIV